MIWKVLNPLLLLTILNVIIVDSLNLDCMYPGYTFPVVCDENNTRESDDNTHNVIKLISEIAMKMMSVSDIMFHFENNTENTVEDIVKEINLKYPKSNVSDENRYANVFYYKSNYLMYTLKKYRSENKTGMSEYKSYKRQLTHIVLLSDVLMFSNISGEMDQYRNVIIYICINQSKSEKTCKTQHNLANNISSSIFLNRTSLKYSYSVFVVEVTDEDMMNLFRICFFCGRYPEKLHLIYNNSLSEENNIKALVLTIEDIQEKLYLNFDNFTFRISFPRAGIYFFCIDIKWEIDGIYNVSRCSSMTAKEGLMLTEISKRLNFQPLMSNPVFHDTVGIWNNMILDVNRTQSDFAIGSISIAQSRQDKVLYSDAIGDDPLRVVYMIPMNVFQEGLSIIFVFSVPTWVVLILTCFAIAILLFAGNRFYAPDERHSFIYNLTVVCCILVEQSIQNCDKIPGRRFLFAWLLCCIIICTAYKARLTAILVNPPQQHLASLEELALDGYIAYLNEADGSLVTGFFSVSSSKVLRDISEKSRINVSICNALKKSLNGKYMVIEESVPIFSAVNNKCPLIMNEDDLERVRITKDYLFPSNHAWPFQKKSPYVKSFNYYIALFFQAGLIDKWSESLFATKGGDNYVNFQTGFVDNSKRKEMNLYGLFFTWLFGIILATTAFIIEISVYMISKHCNKKID